MFSTAVLGAAGFSGQETLDRVLAHPELELVALGSDSLAGQPADALDPRLSRNGHVSILSPTKAGVTAISAVVDIPVFLTTIIRSAKYCDVNYSVTVIVGRSGQVFRHAKSYGTQCSIRAVKYVPGPA